MLNVQLPVSFSRLPEINGAKQNSIIVFNAFEEPDLFTAAVVKKGLESGSIDVLIKNIDCLFKSGYNTNKAGVLSNLNVCMAKLENRVRLGDLLLNSNENLKRVQASSYLHHNGFRKIVLLESKYFKLRLHIFEPINQIVAQENIHDHRWPFSSVCLDGDLTCRIFENDEDTNSEFLHYKYSPVGTSENYSVSPMGNSKLHKSSLLEIQHGTGYYLPVETLHRVINGSDERVITYVVTGTPIKNVCNLYCEHEFESNEVAVERFTDEEIENAITELIYL